MRKRVRVRPFRFDIRNELKTGPRKPEPGSRGAVDVSVKNPGQSPAVGADKFTYTACITPNLKHKTLKKAKEALKKAGCRLGTAKGPKSKSTKVKKQNPKPGKVLAPGAKVNVKLG